MKYYDINTFNAWKNAVKNLAKSCGGEIRENNTCCPCVVFESGNYVCVAYLHSDTLTPSICLNGVRIDADQYDVNTIYNIIYYHFA